MELLLDRQVVCLQLLVEFAAIPADVAACRVYSRYSA